MPQGLQIRNTADQLVVDTSTRIGSFLGSITVSNTDGFVTNNSLGLGTPFYQIKPLNSEYYGYMPTIKVEFTSGSWRISWEWPTSGAVYNPTCILDYGVF
jgi:hypothetical protein